MTSYLHERTNLAFYLDSSVYQQKPSKHADLLKIIQNKYGSLEISMHKADIVLVDPGERTLETFAHVQGVLVDYRYIKDDQRRQQRGHPQTPFTQHIVERAVSRVIGRKTYVFATRPGAELKKMREDENMQADIADHEGHDADESGLDTEDVTGDEESQDEDYTDDVEEAQNAVIHSRPRRRAAITQPKASPRGFFGARNPSTRAAPGEARADPGAFSSRSDSTLATQSSLPIPPHRFTPGEVIKPSPALASWMCDVLRQLLEWYPLLNRKAVMRKLSSVVMRFCDAGVSSLIYKIWERAGNEEFKAHFRPIFAAKMSSTSASSQNAVASPSKAALETSVAAAVAHFNRQVGELDRGKDRRVLPPHYPRPPASLMSWSSGHRYNREDENWFYKMYRYLIETFGREITDVEMALLIIEATNGKAAFSMLECFIQDPVRRKVLQAIDKEFGRVIVNSRMGQGKRPHEFASIEEPSNKRAKFEEEKGLLPRLTRVAKR